mmetsp:Transcript_111830/g.194125  ORF Transcript_111830/g.194125 Transcript_111830/m.194125 type:complete len:153 (+) Transcript_111830:61-519(+)
MPPISTSVKPGISQRTCGHCSTTCTPPTLRHTVTNELSGRSSDCGYDPLLQRSSHTPDVAPLESPSPKPNPWPGPSRIPSASPPQITALPSCPSLRRRCSSPIMEMVHCGWTSTCSKVGQNWASPPLRAPSVGPGPPSPECLCIAGCIGSMT